MTCPRIAGGDVPVLSQTPFPSGGDDPEIIVDTAPPLILSARRRVKASLVLLCVWMVVIVLHVGPVTRWAVTGLAASMVVYAGRLTIAAPVTPPATLEFSGASTEGSPIPSDLTNFASLQPAPTLEVPRVSLMIPAKNESLVISHLLSSLQALDYPADRFEVWAIDDASTDGTADVLQRWKQQFPQLHVYRRQDGASGGKSGALNEVLPLTSGEIVGILDADATVPVDFLRRSLAVFQEKPEVAALQLRKAIANSDENFWTRNQMAEMALDSYFQQQRRAIGGLGELRGNGQLVRRSVLENINGWNEATITDDLDLTFRLHLFGQDVAFLSTPAVREEGVVRWANLWPQRTRWAEGGYQRYLDYWPGILKNRLGSAKTFDLAVFFLIQYLLPIAAVPDFLMAVRYSHTFVLWPLSLIMVSFSSISMARGLYRTHNMKGLELLRTTAVGTAYMLHWIPVMILTTAKMCVRAKQLKWVKTLHVGAQGSGA
ncbi:MAG: glycosyltransferase family 2 protein [Cyanobacteria bacterium P01_G01_bin.4]